MVVLASLVNGGCRFVLIISAAVILGLSVWLDHYWKDTKADCQYAVGNDAIQFCYDFVGRWPTSSAYGAFTGAFGLLAALVGLVPTVVHSSVVVLGAAVLDILATIFYLAAGINYVVLFHNYDSFDDADEYCNEGDTACDHIVKLLHVRIGATIAFCWIGFAFSLFSLVALFLIRRSHK